MKGNFKRADHEGNISPKMYLKKQNTWNLASVLGVTFEQAEDFLVYCITRLHNVAIDNVESNPEVAKACRDFNRATFKLYHVPDEKVNIFAWIGLNHVLPEPVRPDFLDSALKRFESGNASVAVDFGKILLAKDHGLN